MTSDDSELLSKVKHSLDESVDNLDAGVRSRLTRARHRALDQKEPAWFSSPMQWVGVATVATALLVVFFSSQHPTGTPEIAPFDDVEILASADQLDLYEDLEFYAWLSEENVIDGSPGEVQEKYENG